MSNINAPFGFRPDIIADETNKYATYTIASGYATNLFLGDPVKLAASGVNGHPSLVIANPGDSLAGIFAGAEWTDYSGRVRRTNYWPASTVATNIKAFVCDNPYTKFRVQLSGAYADSMLGQLFDFVAGAGSASAGSAYELDSTTAGTGTGFKLVNVLDVANNLPAANAIVEVVCMKHWVR